MPNVTPPAKIIEVKLLLERKQSYRDIADRVGCSRSTVNNIAKGRLWPAKPKPLVKAENFRSVAAYYCEGCRSETMFEPCVVCVARERLRLSKRDLA